MSEGSIVALGVALLAAIATLAGAIFTYIQARAAHRENRQEHLEARLSRTERDNRLLWLWCRELIDHIYRGDDPPPPAAPTRLFEDTYPKKENAP